MNDMIKRKDTKHMIVPFDDQTAVCRTARTVVWEGLALRVSPYPIVPCRLFYLFLCEIESFLIDPVHDPLASSFGIPYPFCDIGDEGCGFIDGFYDTVIDAYSVDTD